jgi:flagellar P-ring protein precursor FlgI
MENDGPVWVAVIGVFMRRLLPLALLVLAALSAQPALAKSRIKDIVEVEGMRENQLTGQGLVVGLSGTGDNLRNCPMTQQMSVAWMERQGVNVRGAVMNTKNIAFVTVTAMLPAFATPGSTIDITVSSACDAKSLLGGTLDVTSLQGADGNTYAVGQGTVQTGAVSASGASGSSISRGVPTSGRIASGATVELQNGWKMSELKIVRLNLRNPDFTTSRRIADAINGKYPGTAVADNASVVSVTPPGGADVTSFVTAIENLEVEPDNPARVVIDEVNGVISIGDAVRLSTVAVQQGNLTITVQESTAVSQPSPFAQVGTTTSSPVSNVKVDEDKGKGFVVLKDGGSLKSLVDGLNKLGVSMRDMESILQNLKRQGALQADLEVL